MTNTFRCGAKTVDGERLVALFTPKDERNSEGHVVAFSIVHVSAHEPIPETVVRANNQIVPADVFLQAVLDCAWSLGMRPTEEAVLAEIAHSRQASTEQVNPT